MRIAKWLVVALAASAAALAQANLEPGLELKVYDLGRNVDRTPAPAEGQLPNYAAVIKSVDLSDERAAELGGLTDNFLAVITGRLTVPDDGLYGLRLTSDDGSLLSLNGTVVVNSDGLHGPEPKESPAFLKKGNYALELRWFEAGGGANCKLEWKRPGGDWELLGGEFLSTPAGVERKTAPGAKQVVFPPVPAANAGGIGLPPSLKLEPARPMAYWPQVAGLTQLPDGRPLVLDQATGRLVWVSAGIPPQTVAKDLIDPLGVCQLAGKVYVLCAGHLYEAVEGPKGWTQREVLKPSGQDLFTAGPVAFGNEILFTIGSDPKQGRLSAFNPAGRRAVNRLAAVPSPVGLVADRDRLMVVSGAGAAARLVAVNTRNRTWTLGPATVVPVASEPDTTVQPAMLGDFVVLGDGHSGLLMATPSATGGTVTRLGDGLESTPRAVTALADGALLVGCDGHEMTLPPFGLQKLVKTGEDAFMVVTAKPLANGLEIQFAQPLADPAGWDPGLFGVEAIVPGADTAAEPLKVASASASDDRMRVFLEVPGIRVGQVLHLKAPMAVKSTTKLPLWTRELWVTVASLPAERGQVRQAPEGMTPNKLTAAEQTEGWKLLFDGEKLDSFRGFRRQDTPGGWLVSEGWLHQRSTGGGGDLMTKDTYENFELALDFVLTKGCNSGIMYRVTEDVEPSFASGPEIQIQDDGSPNSTEIHSCGALYEMFAPNDQKLLNPPGEVNHFLIRLVKGHGEHWLNGRKIVAYEIGSDAWKAQYAKSKFAQWNRFGTEAKGHLVIQDHGTEVWYRNIKIREIGG